MLRYPLASCLFALLAAAGGRADAADLYGGGADSAAVAYVGDAYLASSPSTRLSRDPAIAVPAVAFGVAALANLQPGRTPVFADFHSRYPSDAVSYCRTGTIFAKKLFNGQQLQASGACAPLNFAGVSALEPRPDFVGADAPFSTADYNAFVLAMQAERSAVVQLPVLAQAVAVIYNGGTGAPLALNLSTAQLCQIFAGDIVNWGDSRLGTGRPPGPIAIVYPNAGSGSAFALSSYLAARCNASFGHQFRADADFAVAVGAAMQRYAAVSPRFSESDAVAAVRSTAGALGFSGLGEAQAQGARYATVDGYDPAALPPSLNIAASSLLQGMVLDGNTVNQAPPMIPSVMRNCLKLVSPSVPLPNLYPIVGFHYLDSYYAGNGAKAPALRNLLRQFLRPTAAGAPDTRVTLPPGYSYLDGNLTLRFVLHTAINNCIN
ncbi:substrate-binding domain-containing protein [Lysobacter enzymogenes]|uniref:PstS family phosphate ABC transporter substrate-binding protein n=1 Tax=Lysobacter enzymogenes TaxID=69 RepID=UPI003748BD17